MWYKCRWHHCRRVLSPSMGPACGYFQLPMAPEDAHKSAFITHMGLHEWLVLPQGISNSPVTIARWTSNSHVVRVGHCVTTSRFLSVRYSPHLLNRDVDVIHLSNQFIIFEHARIRLFTLLQSFMELLLSSNVPILKTSGTTVTMWVDHIPRSRALPQYLSFYTCTK